MSALAGLLQRAQGLAGRWRPAAPRAWTPPHAGPPSFDDLSAWPPEALVPPLDRQCVDLDLLSDDQRTWRETGVVIRRGFLPDSLMDPYIARRAALRTEAPALYLPGWSSPTPYQHVPEMRALALYPPLMELLAHLIGEPMMLHLALTGWVSTERNWHQDDYLNPSFVNSWYAAVWMALGDIGEDCGPFEYIPGSHRWPLLRQAQVRAWMSPEERAERAPSGAEIWPKTSERFVVPAIEAEIDARGAKTERFLARKGDVLIWHGRLMHRGSLARVRETLRPALITHYSGTTHRPDMTRRATDEAGNVYAIFDRPLI